jgi:membrane-associated protease RseP (regulator of RpoE activity)
MRYYQVSHDEGKDREVRVQKFVIGSVLIGLIFTSVALNVTAGAVPLDVLQTAGAPMLVACVAPTPDQAATQASAPSAAATQAANLTANRGYLGISALAIGTCGVQVVDVVVGSPADKAGLQAGDVIVSIDDTSITTLSTITGMEPPKASTNSTVLDNFFGSIESRGPDTTVILGVLRNGVPSAISVTLGGETDGKSAATQAAATTLSATMNATMAATAVQ